MKKYKSWLKDPAFGSAWVECNDNDICFLNCNDYIKLISNTGSARYSKIIGNVDNVSLPMLTIKTKKGEIVEVNCNEYNIFTLEYISNEDFCNTWINRLVSIILNYSYKYKELIDETEIIIDEKEDFYKFNINKLREHILKLFYVHSF